jgi:hypothetical protein
VTRTTTSILDSGDPFPVLGADSVAHGRIDLPDYFAGHWGVLLVYRAHW